ncbi:MAG: T9SS type A sorting domain-containing protein [Paludibacter sp.]
MKQLFTLAIALFSLIAVQAQTVISVLNSDFEDTTTPLALNANNQYAIKGFYLVDNVKKPVGTSLDAFNSGLAPGLGVDGSQALKLTPIQTAAGNTTGHMFDVTTEPIDISSQPFGAYSYSFQEKVTEAMATIRPTGFTMFAYDANMLDVTSATLTSTGALSTNASADFITNFNYQLLGSTFSIKANATGLNAKYLKLAISIGKNLPTATLTTSIYLDNFKLTLTPVTGLNSVNANFNVQIYPNPTQDFAQINCADGIDEVCLYSVSGSLINKVQVAATSHRLDISTLSNGIYFVSVKNNKGVVNTKINKI